MTASPRNIVYVCNPTPSPWNEESSLHNTSKNILELTLNDLAWVACTSLNQIQWTWVGSCECPGVSFKKQTELHCTLYSKNGRKIFPCGKRQSTIRRREKMILANQQA